MIDNEGPEESEHKKQKLREIEERLAEATPMVKFWYKKFTDGLPDPVSVFDRNRNEVWALAKGEMDNPHILEMYEGLTPDELAEVYFVLYGESLDEEEEE